MFGCLFTAHFSIILDGSQKGFFSASRGLRRGDPLLPFLFTLAANSFSQIIINAESKSVLNVASGFLKLCLTSPLCRQYIDLYGRKGERYTDSESLI